MAKIDLNEYLERLEEPEDREVSQTVTTNGNFFSIMLSEVTTSPNVGRSSSRTSRTGKS